MSYSMPFLFKILSVKLGSVLILLYCDIRAVIGIIMISFYQVDAGYIFGVLAMCMLFIDQNDQC